MIWSNIWFRKVFYRIWSLYFLVLDTLSFVENTTSNHWDLPEAAFLRWPYIWWQKLKMIISLTCFCMPRFFIFSNVLVCYNSYQGLSLIQISSKFLFLIKSYIEPTIQILKVICLRLCGEKSLMIKWCLFDVCFERRILRVILTNL